MTIENNLLCEGWDGPCDNTTAIRYRMNTNYANEESNYRILCRSCQEACDKHWEEMWKEYYSTRI